MLKFPRHAWRPLALLSSLALLSQATLPAAPAQTARGRAGSRPQSVVAPATPHWVSTWAAPPVGPMNDPATPGPGPFTEQSLRMIVRTSTGGTKVQVRFSNVFNTEDLIVGAAHIALRDTGANILPGSDRVLTFGGRTTAKIPPGALVLSDPVTFDVPALGYLAISYYLPGTAIDVPTYAGRTNQTSYISPTGQGDATGTTAFPVGSTTTASPLLMGVDVLVAGGVPGFVTFGDSITEGFQSSIDANARWPDFFKARFFAQGRTAGVANVGLSGNRAIRDRMGPNGLSRFDRDVLARPGLTHLTVLLGINDIGLAGVLDSPTTAPTPGDLIAAYRQFIARGHDRGAKVIGGTLLPFKGALTGSGANSYYTPEKEQTRVAVNAWIRRSGGI